MMYSALQGGDNQLHGSWKLAPGVLVQAVCRPHNAEEGNCIYITYDEPLLLGAIRVWNYAKTPSRGVQEMEVYLDDQLVYKVWLVCHPRTTLGRCSPGIKGAVPDCVPV